MPIFSDPVAPSIRQFPELEHIFRDIDLGIAAIIASDPTLHPRIIRRQTRKTSHARNRVGKARNLRRAA